MNGIAQPFDPCFILTTRVNYAHRLSINYSCSERHAPHKRITTFVRLLCLCSIESTKLLKWSEHVEPSACNEMPKEVLERSTDVLPSTCISDTELYHLASNYLQIEALSTVTVL
jgi:hypothetical protein